MNPIIIIRFRIVLRTLIIPNNLWIPKCFPYIVLKVIYSSALSRPAISRFNLCLFSFVVCKIKLICGKAAPGDISKVPFIYQEQINAKASYETTAAALFTQSTCCHSTTREHRHVVYKTASEPRRKIKKIQDELQNPININARDFTLHSPVKHFNYRQT